MKTSIINKGHDRLLLFFLGWAMDETPFRTHLPADCTTIFCHSYHTLNFDTSLLQGYTSVRVVAWSMGVWAASQVLNDLSLPIVEAIAVNGTPTPIDDEKGIPVSIFRGTLQGMDAHSFAKFRRRMCGAVALKEFLRNAPCRTLEDVRDELSAIEEMVNTRPVSSFPWSRAYIGLDDKIIPAGNQQRAWEGKTQVVELVGEHYPATLWPQLLNG